MGRRAVTKKKPRNPSWGGRRKNQLGRPPGKGSSLKGKPRPHRIALHLDDDEYAKVMKLAGGEPIGAAVYRMFSEMLSHE
jgi:hypothetical protein